MIQSAMVFGGAIVNEFMKILIIEDNEQDQKIMKKLLVRSGFEDIHISQKGEDGIEHVKKEAVDIVLVDTMLPGIDGFETCKQLKGLNGQKLKVIVMTGRIDAVDADKARKMGADDYCVKTSDYLTLIDSVKALTSVNGKGTSASKESSASSPASADNGVKDVSWGVKKTNEGIRILYKELEKKNDELKALDNLKSEFVAMVSHELRTPLALINGVISQMLEGVYGNITDVQRQKLSVADRGAKLLRRIIDDLLDLSRLEAGEIKLDKDVINLVDVANFVKDSFINLAQQKGVELKVTLKKDEVKVVADRDRITQVLTNFVGNSFKFTEKGCIEIIIEDTENEGICRVRDTGTGISPEDLPKVFERFQQFGKKYGAGQEGAGLGLTISKSIVELHKGRITAQSKRGAGSTFSFILKKKE